MSRRRRALVALLVGLGVSAVAVTVGAPLLHERAATSAAAATAPHGTQADGAPGEQEVHTTIPAGRLLFVGASYSIGLGATGPTASYPSLLAGRLDRRFTVDAVSGTGFQNPGRRHAGTFAQRIARISPTPPARIVIIQGGRDDTRYPTAREYTAALDTIRLAQTRFGTAQVVVLGPIPASLPVSAKVDAVRTEIGRACLVAHAGFIDPIALGWITAANVVHFAGRVHGHPNDAGYSYIASKLIGALPQALKEAQPPLLAHPTPTVTPTDSDLT